MKKAGEHFLIKSEQWIQGVDAFSMVFFYAVIGIHLPLFCYGL